MIKIVNISILSLLLLSGCNLGNATGYVPTSAEIKQVKLHVDTRTSIEEKFGRPMVVGEDGRTWYYISSYRKYVGALPEIEENRRVLKVVFDANDRVISMTESGLKQAQDIALANSVTETGGRRLSLADQLLGNIGNFSAESFLAQGMGNQ